jgi:hypothetical protein
MEPRVTKAGLARYGGYDLKRGIRMPSPSMVERSAALPRCFELRRRPAARFF